MRKIYSFSDFSSLYEADAVTPTQENKLYSDALGQILTYALSAHGSGSEFPIAPYAKEKKEPDYNLVKSSPVLNKPEALKKIMANVQKAAEDNTAEGAKEAVDAYVAVGVKAADALTALINQYKDQPEELESINTSINSEIDDWIKILNESLDYSDELDYSELNEGDVLFQGKKGKISDVLSRLADLTLKLKNLAESPGMASAVSSFQSEANGLQASMGALQNKKNREINKADITNADNEITRISAATDKLAEKMLKQDVTNKEAAAILIGAFKLLGIAQNLRGEYLKKKEEASNKAKSEKIKVTLAVPTIDYAPEETKNVNPEVKKFQELVVDKFKKNKQISSIPQYTKMGTDGKFGPNTRDIIKILKKGFELPETSGDITKQLVDEIQIQADTIGESANTRVFKFSDFINISEAAFNVTAAVEYAKELPTYKPASTGSGASSKTAAKAEVKKEEVKKEEVKKEDTSLKQLQALSDGEIQNIAKELIEASSGSTDEAGFLSAVEKLKNKKDFQILDGLLKRAKEARLSPNPYAELKKLGLSRGSEYGNLAAMINGEMGSDDTGTVRLIKDHLKKIGVDASYSSAKNGEFIEDSFTIK
jgi:hypothetical protein